MSRLPAPLSANTLTGSMVDQFVADTNEYVQITGASVSNSSATSRWVTVTVTQTGGGSAKNLVYQVQVPAYTGFTLFELVGQSVMDGGKVSAQAETAGVLDLVISGIRVQG